MQRNRLADETSPYLLQHADNPVDWFPWSAAALAAARRDDKPILLSIGYSACHWCHVMAHESFEDPATAAVMNELFVNIKVDREERPDLDKIYQVAQQLLTHGSGGWPLTMFLTPDQQPFFGGTYFPREARHGMPAFADLLQRVAQYYRSRRHEIVAQSAQIGAALTALAAEAAAEDVTLDSTPLDAARAALERSFDTLYGGFSRAPKFPHPGSIERCMRHWYHSAAQTSPDLKALYMATLSLTRMAEGGLYDQLGGGFCRYSVDDYWMIPHFEKMLYDNALLLADYARAHLATGEPLFARIAAETAQWVLRDMHAPAGGFYSSLDADSEGHEGRFYVWTPVAVQGLLTPDEFTAFAQRFGLDRGANFDGVWHLHACRSIDEIAADLDASTDEVAARIDAARAKLLECRNLRVWPGRDDKVLTSWNGLMIKGLAIAARALHRPDFTAAATRAVDFIHRDMLRDGRLLATCKDGRAHLPAYLDDYAFLIDALLELLQTRWRSGDLALACRLLQAMREHFEDAAGGFHFTADDHEALIHRTKSYGDDSLPSGNGVAVSVLCRLAYLLGDLSLLQVAERSLRSAYGSLTDYPQAHLSMAAGLEDYLYPAQIVIIRGTADRAADWARQLQTLYAPHRMIFAIPHDAEDLPPALAAKQPGGATVAYVCTGMTCTAPQYDLAEVTRLLTLRLS
jgi:uncharacterized protein YyaL (SSP411 family)